MCGDWGYVWRKLRTGNLTRVQSLKIKERDWGHGDRGRSFRTWRQGTFVPNVPKVFSAIASISDCYHHETLPATHQRFGPNQLDVSYQLQQVGVFLA
jgi:hypothetical protein